MHTYIVYSNNISKIVEKHCMQCVLFSQQFSAALPLVHSAYYYYYCCTSKSVHVCVCMCLWVYVIAGIMQEPFINEKKTSWIFHVL